jgi:hypothetical protein
MLNVDLGRNSPIDLGLRTCHWSIVNWEHVDRDIKEVISHSLLHNCNPKSKCL